MSTRDNNDLEQAVRSDQETAEFSGAASGTVNDPTQNPSRETNPSREQNPSVNPSLNPTSGTTPASGRRFNSQRSAEEHVRSLEQLVTSQTDIISTLTDRLTQITIDMDRMSNWIQRHPHHQSPTPIADPNRLQSEPSIVDLYRTAPPIGT